MRPAWVLVAMFAAAPAAAEVVRFSSQDGFSLEGELTMPPGRAPAPGVVLAHGFRFDRSSYAPLVPRLNAAGIAALALDLRGRGGSTREVARKELLTTAQQQAIWLDLAAALDFLGRRSGVDGRRLALVGASFSGVHVLRAARDRPEVRAVVVLAGGPVPEESIPYYRDHAEIGVLLLAAADDPAHAAVEQALAAIGGAGPRRRLKIFPSGGHATMMFGKQVGAEEEIVDFLRAQLK